MTVSRDVWGLHPAELSRRRRRYALEYIALLIVEGEIAEELRARAKA